MTGMFVTFWYIGWNSTPTYFYIFWVIVSNKSSFRIKLGVWLLDGLRVRLAVSFKGVLMDLVAFLYSRLYFFPLVLF